MIDSPEQIKRIIKACEHVQKDCLKHMKSGKSCSECFYWCDKGPKEYHNCIFWRVGLGHPDTWSYWDSVRESIESKKQKEQEWIDLYGKECCSCKYYDGKMDTMICKTCMVHWSLALKDDKGDT